MGVASIDFPDCCLLLADGIVGDYHHVNLRNNVVPHQTEAGSRETYFSHLEKGEEDSQGYSNKKHAIFTIIKMIILLLKYTII